MELVKRIKNFFKTTQTKTNNKLDVEREHILSLDDTVDTICHYPKISLAITLLELQRFIQLLNPNDLTKFTENDFYNVDDREVFKKAINTLEIIHARTEHIKIKEVH